MASTQAYAEEDDVQRKRILIQHSKFRNLATNYAKLASELEIGSNKNSEKYATIVCKELLQFEYWDKKQMSIKKTYLMDQDNFKRRILEHEQEKDDLLQEIELRKQELKEVTLIRQHAEEYEIVRKQIMAFQSRTATLMESNQLQTDIKNLKMESQQLDLVIEKRQKQLAVLLHSIRNIIAFNSDEFEDLEQPR